ncbi:MAG: FAD/NAD(P)-binding protein [Verrucomicrobiota bacterium]|nr:FAD/NAD(P)-binding protein [Verrucomicrobiota bacterium]
MAKKKTSAGGTDIYLPEMATVVRSAPMTELDRFLEFRLDSGRELGHRPGQFVELSVLGVGEAPISISSSPTQAGSFQMVARQVGNVTRALHALAAGEKVGIRGPFGTEFQVDGAMKGKDLLFICGGIGLAPVRSAINYVMDRRADYGKVTILFGARTPAERLFTEETRRWAAAPGVTYQETVDRGDEGWTGNVGVITTLMPRLAVDPGRTVAVICGPPVMYKFVLLELRKLKISDANVYVSLERHMKCGVGKCGHCQVNGIYVCQKGPVFRYSDVAEVREAI